MICDMPPARGKGANLENAVLGIFDGKSMPGDRSF